MTNPSVQQVTPVCIKAPVVAGAGETEVLERITLDVPTLLTIVAPLLPAGLLNPTLAEVVVLTKKVTITDCEVFNGKILVNGLLHKDLLLKILPTTNQNLSTAVVGGTDCVLRAGVPVDLAIDCPFGACITVPGACPGDQCQVELACVDAEKELLIDTNGDGLPELFEEKVCIRIQVKAIRSTQLTITPNETNICPQFPPVSTCPPSPCLQFLPASTTVQRLQTTI
jgi:hypothetical protein